uniref:Uncharacterized protein n=1 Tax=Anopheles darlingi TaxID=43151 RepID=A0A2M4D848_ANODA
MCVTYRSFQLVWLFFSILLFFHAVSVHFLWISLFGLSSAVWNMICTYVFASILFTYVNVSMYILLSTS